MLETLVSSRIRRTLFEYLLTHPTDRFYLRGLAKELGVSVSPLRRELARLERSGMLRALPEGNIRFYIVNTLSPAFVQLQHAGRPADPIPATTEPPALPAPACPVPDGTADRPLARQAGHAIPVGVISARPLRTPVLLGAAIMGLTLMLIMTSLFYLTMTNERLASAIRRTLTVHPREATIVAPQASSASGVMRGSRWQIVPGGFGGFSSGASNESY